MKKRTPLIVGNWKMNPVSGAQAKSLFIDIRKRVRNCKDTEVVIAAPFVYLSELGRLSPSGRVGLGAQDVFYEKAGTFTGEVSPSMLVSAHVSHVIVGHSERRALGESDKAINKKVLAALKAKLVPVLCIGETKRDRQGDFFSTIDSQLKSAFTAVPKAGAGKVVVAYEPVWAISKGDGRGKVATTEDVEEMRLYIQKVLTQLYGRAVAQRVRIIYGGSVNAGNCAELWNKTAVDGFLPGGASLRPEEFGTIVKSVSN